MVLNEYQVFNCGYNNYVRADLIVDIENCSPKFFGRRQRQLSKMVRIGTIDLAGDSTVQAIIHLEDGRRILTPHSIKYLYQLNKEVFIEWQNQKLLNLSVQLESDNTDGALCKSSSAIVEESS